MGLHFSKAISGDFHGYGCGYSIPLSMAKANSECKERQILSLHNAKFKMMVKGANLSPVTRRYGFAIPSYGSAVSNSPEIARSRALLELLERLVLSCRPLFIRTKSCMGIPESVQLLQGEWTDHGLKNYTTKQGEFFVAIIWNEETGLWGSGISKVRSRSEGSAFQEYMMNCYIKECPLLLNFEHTQPIMEETLVEIERSELIHWQAISRCRVIVYRCRQLDCAFAIAVAH